MKYLNPTLLAAWPQPWVSSDMLYFDFELNSTDAVIRIDGNIRVRILSSNGKQVRIGIEAPPTLPVHREEIYHAVKNGFSVAEGRTMQQLLNPRPFVCLCGRYPTTKRTPHATSKKRRDYWQSRCEGCGNSAPHNLSRGLSILEWNLQPVSQTPFRLAFPGLEDQELSLAETRTLLLREKEELATIRNDKTRSRMSNTEWELFQIRQKWVELGLHSVKEIKRRLEITDEDLSRTDE